MPTGPSPPFDGSDEFNFGAPPQDPDARDAPALGAPPQPDSLDNFLSSISTSRPNSPFDDLITAIAKRPILGKGAGTLPPATRFRVRVAEVGKPHRATKRNYDYFEDLNAVIAASAERSDIPYLA
jgi:hypothetical protein